MARLPASVKIIEDELFVTWMETVARLNGCETETEMRAFFDAFFNGCRCLRITNYPMGVDVFFNWMDILRRHTDLYMILPFLSSGIQGKIFEFCLRNPDRTGAKFIGRGGVYIKRKICPMCLKEDIKQYGRKIVHVSHQQSEVCWKHGVKLLDEHDKMLQIENGTQQQVNMAKFSHDLYENPIIANYEKTGKVWNNTLKARGLTAKQAAKLAAKAGYIGNMNGRYTIEKMDTMVKVKKNIWGLFTWLYGTVDNFRNEMKFDATMFEKETEHELLKEIDIIGKYRCKTCGYIFYMHPEAVKRGAPCPSCNRFMTEEQIRQQYVSHYSNNDYEIVDNNKIRHKLCGTAYEANLSKRLWKDNIKCKICDSQLMRWQKQIDPTMTEYKIIEKRTGSIVEIEHIPYQHNFTLNAYNFVRNREVIYCRICNPMKSRSKMERERKGEENVDWAGKKRVIISYQNNQNIKVQYSDGKTYKMPYQSFKNGRIPAGRIHVNHVGEKKINQQNEELEIVKYRTLQDLDVRYMDGSVVEHVTYGMFIHGTITREKCIFKK